MKIKYFMTIVLLSTIGLFSGCGKLISLARDRSALTENYPELVSKKEELANFQSTSTPSLSDKETPKIKGKVVIVKKDAAGQIEFDRFDKDGKFSDAPVSKLSPFYPPEVYAKKPEEIDTLIKMECREQKGSDLYKSKRSSVSELKEYINTICNVSLIDYKTKTLLAKYQSGSESAPTYLSDDDINDKSRVTEEIADYLTSLPLELIPRVKPTPNGEVLAAAEIAKLFKQSKESVSQYQNKEITLTGWAYFSKPVYYIHLYGNEKKSGIDSITCKVDSKDVVDFAEIKASEDYKFTVVGKFKADYSMELQQCRFISAEEVIPK